MRHLERREPTIAAGALLVESPAPEEERSLDAVREVLLAGGEPSERELARLLAAQVGLPCADLGAIEIDAAAARLLPARFCRRFGVLPIGVDDGVLVVAVAHPSNDVAIDAARGMLRRELELVVVTRSELFDAMARLDRPAAAVSVPAPADRAVDSTGGEVIVAAPELVGRGVRASTEVAPGRPRSIRWPHVALAAVAVCASLLGAVIVTNGRSEGEALQRAAPTDSRAAPGATGVRRPTAAPKPVRQAPTPAPGRTFAWVPVPAASSYAFELQRDSKPIFAAQTPQARFTLPSAWSYRGRRYRLDPGQHRWRVWAVDASGERLELVVDATLVI
jgi:MshEN domain